MKTIKIGGDEYVVNLNSREVREAVFQLVCSCDHIRLPKNFSVKDIWFDNAERMLYVLRKAVLRYDRHLHFTKKKDHLFATFGFLEALSELLALQFFDYFSSKKSKKP